MRQIKKGATSQSVYFIALDSASTTGGRKTGIVFNSAGLTAYYARNQNTATAITLATLAAANTAWSSGGFKEVDGTNMPGLYRLDVPDAAFASGADSVVVTIKGASGMVQADVECQLTGIDLQDTVRAGMTALPNAAAEAAGGLYTRGSGAGQINQNANGQVDTRWVAGNVTVGTNNDKTGYSLTQTFPTNFSSLSIDASGRVDLGKWIGTAPAAVTTNGYVQGAVLRWKTDDAAGTINALISGRVDANAQVVGDKTGYSLTQTFPANFSALAIDVGGQITVGLNTDKTGYSLSTGNRLLVAESVWDVLLSGHTTAGSSGLALASASSAGDPWGTALPGAYAAGTAGYLVGNYVNASIAAIPTAAQNADALLGRNVAGGSSAGRLVKEAFYVMRNKTDITAGTLSVYGTDDTTVAFTAAVTTAAGNPISQIDPA